MKIVIELSDSVFKRVRDDYVNSYEVDEMCAAILDGTILPEHHGRLISEEDMISVIVFSKLFDNAKVGEVKEVLLKIPTIIEGSEINV